MTVASVIKPLLCVFLGVAILATVIAFVPSPYLVLAAIVVLPVESMLLALATAPRRDAKEVARPTARY